MLKNNTVHSTKETQNQTSSFFLSILILKPDYQFLVFVLVSWFQHKNCCSVCYCVLMIFMCPSVLHYVYGSTWPLFVFYEPCAIPLRVSTPPSCFFINHSMIHPRAHLFPFVNPPKFLLSCVCFIDLVCCYMLLYAPNRTEKPSLEFCIYICLGFDLCFSFVFSFLFVHDSVLFLHIPDIHKS